jgi:DNA polymerase-4
MILHLDLDAFFASAERIANPHLRDRPIAVGGRADPFIFDKDAKSKKVSLKNAGAFVPTLFHREKKENFESFFKEKEKIRGIVITSSYEARAFGIKTGMTLQEAIKRCPQLLVCVPNHPLYHELSHKLKCFLETKVPSLEQFSIDEFFADVSGWIADQEVESFAQTLKDDIEKEFQLPISIGIAKTKWLAKLSTNYAKPKGVKLLLPEGISDFISDIPIEKFPSIGHATQKKLKQYQKYTLGDIADSKSLLYSWGNAGKILYDRVCGLERESVQHHRDRKSIGISRTFDPIDERVELKRRVSILTRHLIFLVGKLQVYPKTLYVSIRYQYQSSKKQVSFQRELSEDFLLSLAQEMFQQLDIYPHSHVIRLTISLNNFQKTANRYPSLFHYHADSKSVKLSEKTQKLREKYGVDIIKRGSEL